jgi:hypothetical protein
MVPFRIMTGDPVIFPSGNLLLTSRPCSIERGSNRFDTIVCFPPLPCLLRSKIPFRKQRGLYQGMANM